MLGSIIHGTQDDIENWQLRKQKFLPKTTEICYKNVSNVSQNLGGQAVHFVRTNETCPPGKTAEVYGIKRSK